MIKKNHEVKLRQRKLFIILFLFSVFFSFINLFSFLDFDFYPEYFIALLVLTISSNLIEVSINKIFLDRHSSRYFDWLNFRTIHAYFFNFTWPTNFFPKIFCAAYKTSIYAP